MEDVTVYSLNADLYKKIKEKSELRYGFEVGYNDVQSTAEIRNIVVDTAAKAATRYPDGGSSMMSLAAYLSNSYEVDENTILVSGVRFTSISLSSTFKDTTFFNFPYKTAQQKSNAVTGNLGVVFKSENNWKASLLGSTGFRAPNVDDIAKVFGSTASILVVPNPDLKPENAYNLEFNLSKIVENKFRFDMTAFYTLLENALVQKSFKYNGYDTLTFDGNFYNIQATQNANRAYVYGFSTGVSADLNRNFSFKTVLNYTYGRYVDSKTETVVPLDHIPPAFGQTNLLYKASKFEGDFFVRYNGAKKLISYSPSGEDNLPYATATGMPAWFTIKLRLRYNITKNFRLTVPL